MYNIERAIIFAMLEKIKKGKTKNLNVLYLLKRINWSCNFNFYFKITWPPAQPHSTKLPPPPPFPPSPSQQYNSPTKNKKF